MSSKRVDDPNGGRSWFRSDRIVMEGGQWYFLTREGTLEGPFETRLDASERLELYVNVMSLHLVSEDVAIEASGS